MSVLIKGIDMPKEGEHIIALIKTDGKCSYFEQDIETTTCKIMKEAEAIQIPTPHGRLIDGDKIGAEAEQTLYGEVSYEDIANAPTILEEEK